MRHSLRILAYAAATIVIAMVILCIRSILRLDQFQWDSNPRPIQRVNDPKLIEAHQLIVRTAGGGILIVWSRITAPADGYHKPMRDRNFSHVSDNDVEYPLTWRNDPSVTRSIRFVGFEAAQQYHANGSWQRWSDRITLPLWAPCIALGAPSIAWLWRDRRIRLRKLHGCCVRCGYDLRASPHACPECGEVDSA